MKNMKRFLSILLCAIMLTGMLPTSASAKEFDKVSFTFKLPAVGDEIKAEKLDIKAEGIDAKDKKIESTGMYENTVYSASFKAKLKKDDIFAEGFDKDDVTLSNGSVVSVELAGDRKSATITFTFTPHEHSYTYELAGKDNEHHKGTCTICGAEIKPQPHVDGVTYENVTPSTCTVAGSQDKVVRCTVCNYEMSRTKEDLSLAEHDHDAYVNTDPAKHWEACSICGFKHEDTEENHVYDSVTNVCECGRERTSYTVTYNANGGTGAPGSQKKYENVDLVLSTTEPDREHYTFTGWKDANGNSYTTGGSYTANEGATLYAQWIPIAYPIHYHLDGGTLPEDVENPTTYTIESAAITLPIPAKTGFSFKGWYDNAEFNGTAVTTTAGEVIGEKNFYAKWEENQSPVWYAITFIYDNGSKDYTTATNSTLESMPADPIKSGYTFDGWYNIGTDRNNPIPADAEPVDTTTVFDVASYIKAKWTPIKYTVKFVKKGHDVTGEMSDQTFTYDEAQALTANAFEKKDHRFAGWNTEEDGKGTAYADGQSVINLTADSETPVELFAQWEKIQMHKVKFDVHGGSAVTEQQVENGQCATEPEDPTYEGHTFAGWYTDKNYKDEYDFSAQVIKDITLHAKWTKDETPEDSSKHKVTFDWKEIKNNKGENSKPDPMVKEMYVADGEKITQPAFDNSKVKEAHDSILLYWYYEEGEGKNKVEKEFKFDSTQITGDITLHAKCAKIHYVYVYENAEQLAAKNPFDQAMFIEGDTLEAADFEKADPNNLYDKDDSTKKFELPATMTGGCVHLIGVPVPSYTVTFDANGHGTAPAAKTVKAGEKVGNPGAITGVDHYTFGGWYTESNCDNAYGFETTPVNGNITLYAKWTPVEYSITYDLDGGAATNPATYTIETATFTLTNPTKEGYTFAGWSGTDIEDTALEVTIEQGSSGNREYTAAWTKNPVVVSVTVTPESVDLYPGEKRQFAAAVEVTGNLSTDVIWTITPASGISLLSEEDPAAIDENGLVTLGANATGSYIVTATSVADETKSDTAIVNVLPYNTVEFHMHLHGDQVPAQTLKAGEKVTKPTDPTATGYTFGGWYTDDTFTTEYDFNTEVKNSFTLHAKWTEVEAPAVTYFKVTYDANGGKGEMPVVTVESGKVHTILENEFKAPSGKAFKCWKIDGVEFKAGEKIEVTEDVTIKAVWKTKASADLDYVPATGDNFPTFLWAGLLLFSVVALVGVAALRRKRR